MAQRMAPLGRDSHLGPSAIGIPFPRREGGGKPPPGRPPAPVVGFSRPVRTIQVGRARLPASRAQQELRPPALLGRDSHLGPVALGIPIPPAGGRDSPGRANEKEFSFERAAGFLLPPLPLEHRSPCLRKSQGLGQSPSSYRLPTNSAEEPAFLTPVASAPISVQVNFTYLVVALGQGVGYDRRLVASPARRPSRGLSNERRLAWSEGIWGRQPVGSR